MPVTVKFSREFYDRFGHEAVDELVNYLNQIDAGYRSELKELNQANSARFEDKLQRRIGQAESRLIRWSFGFWATTMLAVVGLLIGVILKL